MSKVNTPKPSGTSTSKPSNGGGVRIPGGGKGPKK